MFELLYHKVPPPSAFSHSLSWVIAIEKANCIGTSGDMYLPICTVQFDISPYLFVIIQYDVFVSRVFLLGRVVVAIY